MRIAIAGATGFIGQALIDHLLAHTEHEIVGLSRTARPSQPRVTWRQTNLYDERSVRDALAGADAAFYLVHSMQPTAGLNQGSFEDYDLLLAENFVDASRENGLRQIVYLGGLCPREGENLSPHLRSRLEVENVFLKSDVPSTALRAALIIGANGSSFNILLRLVRRLPVLVCPRWTETLITPVHVRDVVEAMAYVIDHPECRGRSFDIGGSDTVRYRDLMEVLASRLKLRRLFLAVPFNLVRISRLWVRLFASAPRELVYPLLDSLKSEMRVLPERQLVTGRPTLGLAAAYDEVLSHPGAASPTTKNSLSSPTARSVQRLPRPEGFTALRAAREYLRWLPQFLFPLVRTHSAFLEPDTYFSNCATPSGEAQSDWPSSRSPAVSCRPTAASRDLSFAYLRRPVFCSRRCTTFAPPSPGSSTVTRRL
jgi:uncharacterized protein YbjT (DUF2867 family)